MQVQPYLMFDGRCEEAVEFFKDSPDPQACVGVPGFQGFSLAITADDDADAKRRFNALADGGQVQMPLGKTFFASSFGVVADKFGVSWMIVTGN